MLYVKVSGQPPSVTIALAGELDMVSTQTLNTAIKELDKDPIERITICLSKLQFIDSSGIGQLISLYRAFKERGIKFRVENNNREIEEVLELIGLREIIEE